MLWMSDRSEAKDMPQCLGTLLTSLDCFGHVHLSGTPCSDSEGQSHAGRLSRARWLHLDSGSLAEDPYLDNAG